MPSWPLSVFAPTNKSAGQTIQHTHVNDLQDEVVAIEDGYRNATAPLNSSRSTVATLSVLGGSTFASRPTMPPPEAVRVTGCTTALGNNSTAALTWPTQVYALNSSLHSTATNPERFTPQTTGLFMVHAIFQQPDFALQASTAVVFLTIEDSSGTVLAETNRGAGGAFSPTFEVYASKYFNAVGGWVRVVAKQTRGSSNSGFGPGSWCEMRKA